MRRFAAAVSVLALSLATTDVVAQTPPQAPPNPTRGKTKPTSQPALITADQIVHDRDLNTVTASGHVEVQQAGRILLADSLSYNLKQDVVVAAGNVSLTDSDGQVYFTDYMELSGDLKEATAKRIRVLMIDDSRFAAASGRRVAGERTILDDGVYSACAPCAKHPERPPLWQLRAKRISHDEAEHIVEYEDAWLEMDGIPVAYTPYLSHADPTIKRKDGFLSPSVVNNSVVGQGVRIPYFQTLGPNQDLTIAPLFTTEQGVQLTATHRWRSFYGEMRTTGSIVDQPKSNVNSEERIGYHIDAASRFDLDEHWQGGWELQRAVDRNYLSTFGYHPQKPYLTTRPYLEGFGYRDFVSIEGYNFQSLTATQTTSELQRKEPIVAPLINVSKVTAPATNGGYWTFDGHSAAVTRSQGTSSRRVNTVSAYNLPYTSSIGEIWHFTASVRADAYNSDNPAESISKTVNQYRMIPQVSVDWRWPFTKVGQHSSQTFTPIVMVTASPYGGNSIKIPNEDSLDFELDDVNIFDPMPSTGFDRVVSGPRAAYGFQYQVENRGQTAAEVVLGNSYQLHPQAVFEQGSGLDDRFSDVVGRVNVWPSSAVRVGYRFRVNKDTGDIRRSEVNASLGPRPLNLSMSYVFIDRLNPESPYNQRQQISADLTAQLTRHWSVAGYTTQNLGITAGPLQQGGRIVYDDECLTLTLDGGVNYTEVNSVVLGHYAILRFVFKTLTTFPVDLL